MKILITGKSGFLAREIKNHFKDHELTFVGKSSGFDLTDSKNVDAFFEQKYFDFVFHTAIVGGKRGDEDTEEVCLKNVQMFENLLRNKDKFSYLFNFCSGAAMNCGNGVDQQPEYKAHTFNSNTKYGLSKSVIAMLSLDQPKVYNFRLFGCFGVEENEDRFFKKMFNSFISKKPFSIHKNKYMDFVSVTDLFLVLRHYMQNIENNLPKDINIAYDQKKNLVDLFNLCCALTRSSCELIIEKEGFDSPYTADTALLKSLNINLVGLEESLKNYWNYVTRK